MKKSRLQNNRAFTLIETLVALTILVMAVAAPLTLAAQSLLAAFSARDQMIAFNLAQDAIETVRAQRDHNILKRIKGDPTVNWTDNIPVRVDLNDDPQPFIVDSITSDDDKRFVACTGTTWQSCDKLLFIPGTGDAPGYYAHNNINGEETRFTRAVTMDVVPGTDGNEVTVRSEVHWRAGNYGGDRSVVITTNLYNWVAGIYEENNPNP